MTQIDRYATLYYCGFDGVPEIVDTGTKRAGSLLAKCNKFRRISDSENFNPDLLAYEDREGDTFFSCTADCVYRHNGARKENVPILK